MRCGDAAKRKAIRTKNPQDWANYRKHRNLINNKMKTTKAFYYHNSFIQSEGKGRRTWRTINNLTSRLRKKTTTKKKSTHRDSKASESN